MPAILTISNTVDSNQSAKIVKSSSPEDGIVIAPGISEQITLADGEGYSVETVPAEGESEGQGEPKTEGEAEKSEENTGESQ